MRKLLPENEIMGQIKNNFILDNFEFKEKSDISLNSSFLKRFDRLVSVKSGDISLYPHIVFINANRGKLHSLLITLNLVKRQMTSDHIDIKDKIINARVKIKYAKYEKIKILKLGAISYHADELFRLKRSKALTFYNYCAIPDVSHFMNFPIFIEYKKDWFIVLSPTSLEYEVDQ